MEFEDIYSKIKGILNNEFEVDYAKATPSARFRDELGLDSLDMVDLILALEKAFDIKISESIANGLTRLQDVIDYIHRLKSGQASS